MAETNVLTVNPNGPSVVTGDLVVMMPDRPRPMQTAVLCRCGQSADKPFCDGAHVKAAFVDSGRLSEGSMRAPADAGRLTIDRYPMVRMNAMVR